MLLTEHELQSLGAIRVSPRGRPRRQSPADFSSWDKGLGLEFADYQLYQPGDDIRHIDWTHYHKDGRLVVRKYDQHESVRVHLLVDLTESMVCYGSDKPHAVQRLAAALAVCLLRNGVKLVLHGVGHPEQCQPFSGWGRWQACVQAIQDLKIGGGADVLAELQTFAVAHPRTDHLVILSDFLGEEEVDAWDRYLAPLGQRANLIQPTCDAELEPPLEGGLTLEEAESTEYASLTVDRQVIMDYQQAYQNYYQQLQHFAEHHGCGYQRIRCEDSLTQQLDRLTPDGVLIL